MSYEPWIPHFGNNIPYTSEAEDKVKQLEKELAKAKKEIEQN